MVGSTVPSRGETPHSTRDVQSRQHGQTALALIRRWRYRRLALGAGLWLVGLYFMLFGGGLIKPGPAAVKQYLGTLDQVLLAMGES